MVRYEDMWDIISTDFNAPAVLHQIHSEATALATAATRVEGPHPLQFNLSSSEGGARPLPLPRSRSHRLLKGLSLMKMQRISAPALISGCRPDRLDRRRPVDCLDQGALSCHGGFSLKAVTYVTCLIDMTFLPALCAGCVC